MCNTELKHHAKKYKIGQFCTVTKTMQWCRFYWLTLSTPYRPSIAVERLIAKLQAAFLLNRHREILQSFLSTQWNRVEYVLALLTFEIWSVRPATIRPPHNHHWWYLWRHRVKEARESFLKHSVDLLVSEYLKTQIIEQLFALLSTHCKVPHDIG